jgi:hypothetical protein
LPSNISVPPALLNPASGDDAGSRAQQPVIQVTHKNVTINVQQGISADTIIRSRAQIARGL